MTKRVSLRSVKLLALPVMIVAAAIGVAAASVGVENSACVLYFAQYPTPKQFGSCKFFTVRQ